MGRERAMLSNMDLGQKLGGATMADGGYFRVMDDWPVFLYNTNWVALTRSSGVTF
jgi:hypothetical protein